MLYKIFLFFCFCFWSSLYNVCVAQEPKLILPLEHSSVFYSAIFSPDRNKIVATSWINKTPKILSPSSRNPFIILRGHTGITVTSEFSSDNKMIVTTSEDSTARVWDAETGTPLAVLRGHTKMVVFAEFSLDCKKIVSASDDGTAKIWGWDGMKWSLNMTVLKKSKVQAYSARFSPDGKKIVTGSADDTARIWDVATGNLVKKLIGHRKGINSVQFSPDGKKIITASFDNTAIIWDATSGKALVKLRGHTEPVYTALYSPDGKFITTASNDGTAKIWDGATGMLIGDITGHTDEVKSARYSVDGTRIITASYDHTIKVWDAVSTKCLYTFYAVDSTDYLVVDNESHYDGTEAARKLLYFTCGKDTIDLSQVKDQLWVPKLSERINNGETINAKSLNELDICGLTPEVKEVSRNPEEYYFTIKPRRGGLGDLNLSINGIIADTYQPERLTKNGDVYEFTITKKDFIPYLPEGQINKISLKAYTADNTISSREITISIDKTEKPALLPTCLR
jgi:WD40 repeat protein